MLVLKGMQKVMQVHPTLERELRVCVFVCID